MNPEAARRFVTGKLFAFRCVDGSGGSGAFTVSHKQVHLKRRLQPAWGTDTALAVLRDVRDSCASRRRTGKCTVRRVARREPNG